MATHRWQPDRYHTTIGSHEPVLRIASGDSVVTTTVDAHGSDERGEPVTPGGNPQTGPFFVEGAEPGDVLEVTLDRLTPNRPTGFTATVVAENAVDPELVRELPARGRLSWEIDTARGTARPRRAEGYLDPPPALEGLELRLAPMLGCFGVAPARGQAISTATSGPHGGNMDYRGFTQGVTAFFPVAVPGALLHVGDGHATQGDGEIVGTGIETSFEVQLTCRVRKGGWGGGPPQGKGGRGGGPPQGTGASIQWPRGENDEFVFTVGNARPLDQAVQHATTEMLRWLGQDFGLDLRAASTLLGQAVRYDLGNVFDPAYTMVCKMPRRLLQQAR